MSLGVIIFARMSSRRLPGKMMKKIGSKSLINHIIDRAKMIKVENKLILATSRKIDDDCLVNEAIKANINVYRGSLRNVVKRSLDCCKNYKLESFVRVCGDRLFLDYKEINQVIKKFYSKKNKIDIASNLLNGKIPAGKTIEIISTSALQKILDQTKNKFYLEHISTYIYENKRKFKILKLRKPRYASIKYKYAVDDLNDLKRSKYIYKNEKNLKDLSNSKIFNYTKKWFNKNY
jgi:spore coat polysaccharide biosynthesis protein SpsF